ncbi:hypothetical protein JCM19233_7314 [Vibrio astriarenae]|nr:hypothetical protein JCM19233_7314 [Vibrio sp. C7]
MVHLPRFIFSGTSPKQERAKPNIRASGELIQGVKQMSADAIKSIFLFIVPTY